MEELTTITNNAMKKEKYLTPETECLSVVMESTFICASGENLIPNQSYKDNYSETDEFEDRARIFENICMNTFDDIRNNPYLLKKAKYLESEIIKYYPMLKDSPIFLGM